MAHERVVEYVPVTDVFANPQNPSIKTLVAAAPGRNWNFAAGVPIATNGWGRTRTLYSFRAFH